MLVLHHGDTSTASAKVRLTLAEKGLDYESRLYVLRRGEHKSADYLAINPAGVVPTLIHDGLLVRESTVILEYLEDAFPEPRLLASSPAERAETRLRMREADDLHDACSVLSSAVKFADMRDASVAVARVSDLRKRERQLRIAHLGFDAPDVYYAIALYRSAIRAAAGALSRTAWLSGGGFGLADCAALPFFHRADRLGLAELWADYPAIADWLRRMRERPSYAEAIARFESDENPYRPSPQLAAAVRRAFDQP